MLFSHTQLILWHALLGRNCLRLHQKQRGCRTQHSKHEPSTEPLRTQPPQGMRAASWLMPDLSTSTHSPQKQAPHAHQCSPSPRANPLCRSQEAAPRQHHLPTAPPSLSISQHSCHGTNHTLCPSLHWDRKDPKEIRKTHPLLDTWRHLTSLL